MRRTLLLGAALMLASPLLVGQASAAGAAPLNVKLAHSAAAEAIVEKAGWRRCVRWNRKCAWRWGAGTRRYYRCLARHGC